MPTIKGYSVSNTVDGGIGIKGRGNNPLVYSYSGNPDTQEGHCGRRGAYDGTDTASMEEGGRQQTLLGALGRTGAGDPRMDHDVTDLADPATAGTARRDLDSELVTATTTTISGSGAGLIVQFTVTAAGALPAFGTGGAVNVVPTGNNFRIIARGDGYDTNDVVEIDGWVGSRVAVTAA